MVQKLVEGVILIENGESLEPSEFEWVVEDQLLCIRYPTFYHGEEEVCEPYE